MATIDDFTAKYLPLIVPLGNGNGLFFVRCHQCHCTSPSHTSPDDLIVLAKAKAAGWSVTKVGTEFRCFCPTCTAKQGGN